MTDASHAAAAGRLEIELDDRRLILSNVDKVLWPRLGLTKGWMVEYYTRVGPVLLPHVARHPVTLHRFPDGVDGVHWYETRAPAHPPWIETVTFQMRQTGKVFDVCVLTDLASLLWAAQIAAIELHPFLATADALERPRFVVFDLDPGPPATLVDCCTVGLWLKQLLDDLGVQSWPKTSGGGGLHVYVPLNTAVSYDETKTFARAVARLLERDHPDHVVSVMTKARRAGKVFVDWSQNDAGKSTVAPYSLRGFTYPTVSTPVTWDEVDACRRDQDVSPLVFLPEDVLRRVDAGDLFAPVATLEQSLPDGM